MTPRIKLLADPSPREINYTLISVDDHLVEPANMFEGRLPAKFAPLAPHIERAEDGTEPWVYDGQVLPQQGSNAVVGQADRREMAQPAGFEDMRKGAWDVHERVRDMDINGVWASLNFPSIISGFCGTIFSRTRDPELGLAVTRAWNDWMVEEWHGAHPERLIALAITWLADPELGAAEIRRNAARGVKAVTLPEQPHRLGYPSTHSGYWDPILQACEETDTVICLHVGSSGLHPTPKDAATGLSTVLFPVSSLEACADWIWSGAPLRFPKLKFVMAEGGIGWVPMLLDRFDYIADHAGGPSVGAWGWEERTITPSEVVQRNFYFAVLDDRSTLAVRDRIGVDHIMIEVDYPHADSTWPDSQQHFKALLGDFPGEDIRKITHLTAAKLFRHPLPLDIRP
jgi:predicted TIM-barrel fold metal-dependent hydrolase